MLRNTDRPLKRESAACDRRSGIPVSNLERAASCSDWSRGVRGTLIWGVPAIILAAAGALLPARDLVLVWPPVLAFMGAACVVNARRCGRIHCYATGPFLLILAAATLLYGIGALPLGPHGWSILSDALIVGTVILCFVPELIFGRYSSRASGASRGRSSY